MASIENIRSIQKDPKFFYGWMIVIAAAFIFGIAGGPIIAFGVFIKPMAKEFGWSRGVITGAFGLHVFWAGVLGIVCGLLVDRIGPKILSILCGILMGLGLFMCSRTDSIGSFYLAFGIITGTGYALMFVPLQATIARWFNEKRGLALGIMFAGFGVGGLILSPLLQSWINSYGWRTAFVFISILVLCSIPPLGLLLKKDPSVVGLVPLGESKIESNGDTECDGYRKTGPELETQDFTIQEAIRTGAFWQFSLAMVCMFLAYFMAQVSMVPHATDKGVPVATAALALGIAGGFNAFGRIFMGAVSDKIGTKRALGFCLLLGSIMLFWLIPVRNSWMMYLFAILFGFAWGGSTPQMPRLVSELFGLKSMGGIMGIATLIISLGPTLGPIFGGAIYDFTGSYNPAFLVGGLSLLISFILILVLQVPKKKNEDITPKFD